MTWLINNMYTFHNFLKIMKPIIITTTTITFKHVKHNNHVGHGKSLFMIKKEHYHALMNLITTL